jgi:hypothetical protein
MSEWPINQELPEYVPIARRGEIGTQFPARPDLLFERLNAREWIDQIRVEENSVLDMLATAQGLGVPLHIVEFNEFLTDGRTTGIGLERGKLPIAIYVSLDNPVDHQRMVFGHEVGHLFLEEITGAYIHGAQNQDVERFCDYFGRQMVVDPKLLSGVELIDRETILELMNRYGADYDTLVMQLTKVEGLPSRLAIDTEVDLGATNETYAGKVLRSVACLDCELGIEHEPYKIGDNVPVINFTDKHWDLTFNDCTPHGIESHAAINRLYGRWSEEDEALIQRELEREAEMRAYVEQRMSSLMVDRWAAPEDDWDEPF